MPEIIKLIIRFICAAFWMLARSQEGRILLAVVVIAAIWP